MPSNKDLISAIEAEAATQELEGLELPVTKGKNNNQLVAILARLKTPPPPESAEEPVAEEPVDVGVEKPPYYVADGKSLVCRKGVLDSGDEMKAEYSAGGQESLDALVKKGVVIKS